MTELAPLKISIIGPSGAGKTTLLASFLKCMANIVVPGFTFQFLTESAKARIDSINDGSDKALKKDVSVYRTDIVHATAEITITEFAFIFEDTAVRFNHNNPSRRS
jgi:ABC-type multidrug transport system ATPase subunit